MEKKKIRGKTQKSVLRSIPLSLDNELCKIGEGDWKKGIYESVSAHKIVNHNPELKLMHDVDILMTDLLCYYGDNHYEHFSNFPSCFRQFLKRGHHNWKMMNKRYERTLDEIETGGVMDAK